MEETLVGILIAAVALIGALLGTVVTLFTRRNGGKNHPAGNPGCPVGTSFDEFHRRLEQHMIDQVKATNDQTGKMAKIATILDERLPRRGHA